MTTRNYTSQPSLRGWTANDGKYYGIEAGEGWIPSTKVRLFPNHKGIKFVGAVHELVEPTLKQVGIQMKDCDVPVHHYGKMDPDKVITKGSEYYRLGLKKIEETNGGYRALKELAVQASELEEYDEAVKIWEKAIAVNSKDAVAYINAGYAYFMIKQYDKASVLSQKALELDPDLREAVLNFAGCEFMLGKVKNAIKLLEKILEKEPDYPPAMGRIAAAYIIDGKEKEGLECMRRLQQREYNCSKLIEEQAQELFSQGRADQAMLLREAARKINTSSRKSHNTVDVSKQITDRYYSPVEHIVSSDVPQHQVNT
jgi:Flp pilus assembly protein TadD